MPLVHTLPVQPPTHVALVPLLLLLAHTAAFCRLMNQLGTVQAAGKSGCGAAAARGLTLAPWQRQLFAPAHAARATCS
jgi:hypothetical protein